MRCLRRRADRDIRPRTAVADVADSPPSAARTDFGLIAAPGHQRTTLAFLRPTVVQRCRRPGVRRWHSLC